MKKLFLALLFSLWAIPCIAIAPICQEATINIAAGDQTVSFNGKFSHVQISTSPGASTVYINPNNVTASSADYALTTSATIGGYLQYGLAGQMSAQTGFHYFGAGTTGTLSWIAY
jgi:hypothetical protein